MSRLSVQTGNRSVASVTFARFPSHELILASARRGSIASMRSERPGIVDDSFGESGSH